ncbi:carbohydrate kinase family protein [Candidatus Caldatribacterium sp. SIUC1]|uniref:carbohydrate kinase family protein n=1 Tax=Candidatus Caldatribacterium sp. SIUC1 TaxID=3418365 RepID=UPI003F68ED6E
MPKVFVVGNVSLDLVLGGIPDYPDWGTEVLIPGYVMRPGGAASNASLALAALGVPTFIVATVGQDSLGEEIRNHFAKAGIRVDFLSLCPTRQTAISVGVTNARTKERSFLTDLGAQECLSWEHLEAVSPLLEEGDFLLLCGYFLSPGLRTPKARGILSDFGQRGITMLFDTGWPTEGWTEDVREEIRTLLPLFDYFLPNEKELEGAGGSAIALLPRKGTIVKQGERGCTAHTREGVFSAATLQVSVTDTVGAGDYFNAGFIFGLLEGYPLPLALRCATTVAAFNISTSPKRDTLATRNTLATGLFPGGVPQ